MALRRYRTFTGGIDLPELKDRTLRSPIEPAPLADCLRVPLGPAPDRCARPIVLPGQQVQAGDPLALAGDGGSLDVFAPLSGRVGAADQALIACGDGFVTVPAVELLDLGPCPHEPHQDAPDPAAIDPAGLHERLAEAALTTARLPVQPLADFLDHARRRRCRMLVCNAVESQPYVTSDHRLLVEHGPEVIAGLSLLSRAIGAREAILAVDPRRTRAYADLPDAARRSGVACVAMLPKYPAGADALVAYALGRREVPAGGSPQDVGVAIIDPTTCRQAWLWMAHAVRCGLRVVTVSGDRAGRVGNFRVPIGTPCDFLAGGKGPLLHGGPMTGLQIPPGAVVSASTTAVLALGPPATPRPMTCIRCSWCLNCPVRLNATAISDACEMSDLQRARELGAMACLECGTCSYVCPARLPLAQRVRLVKRALQAVDAPAERPA